MTDTSKTVTAAILVIGNEILSGRTKDANIQYLATELGKLGVRVMECRVIPDIEATGDPVLLDAAGLPLVTGVKRLPVKFTPVA